MNRLLLSFCFVLLSVTPLYAQNQPSPSRVFQVNARAVDAVTLIAGTREVMLWGVERLDDLPAGMKVRARVFLTTRIAGEAVECEAKKRQGDAIIAQCINSAGEDLALLMLQRGFALADHAAIAQSVFEQPYTQAEIKARNKKEGIWSVGEGQGSGGSDRGGMWLISVGLILFLCMIAAFSGLCIMIMRGFEKVTGAQLKNIDLIARERKIRNKERNIIAIMLDAEIKANKSKIEAYLIVYEEMLTGLKDTQRQPKYKRAGDIVQKQPALDRAVFDNNTHKLDILGARLSSDVVHFYARIKTKPEYMNLEPETPLEEALAIVETGIENAKRLNDISDRLIAAFKDGGIASENFLEDESKRDQNTP